MSCNDNLLRNFRLYISEGLLRENLTKAERRDFVRKSVETFVGGIPQIK